MFNSLGSKSKGKNIVLVEGVRTPFLVSGSEYVLPLIVFIYK